MYLVVYLPVHMHMSASSRGCKRAPGSLELQVVCELPIVGAGNEISALVFYSLSAPVEMIIV